jgi:catalase
MKNILKPSSVAIGLVLAVAVSSPAIQASDKKVQATDLVDIFEKLGGKHPGFRKAHAKGLCATGTFEPSASEHFKGAALLENGNLPVRWCKPK